MRYNKITQFYPIITYLKKTTGQSRTMVPKQILVIQTAFIGDVILATSLLETLHMGLPGTRIDIIVRKGNESLFKGHPFLRDILIWDKKGGKYKSLLQLLRHIRKREYDHVLNLQRYGATGLLTAFSGANHTAGFDKNPLSFLFSRRYPHRFEQGIHETDRNHLLASELTDAPLQKPKLYPQTDDYLYISHFQQTPYFCIAPTSVWFTKQFPLEQWNRLIDLLPPKHTIYLLGSPADAPLAEKLASGRAHVVNLCGKLSFLQSAALMEGALMNYVNDSAPMHLCSAVNAPVCAVYCSTLPEFGYGPLSDQSFVIQIETALPCRPCGIHGHKACPEGHFRCAQEIDVYRIAALANIP